MFRISRVVRGNPVGCTLASVLLTLACLFAGYLDLWRGGTGTAAAVLVAGYLGFAPLAIAAVTYAWPRRERAVVRPATTAATRVAASAIPDDRSPPYRVALVVGLLVFVLYVCTLAPSTTMWDTSEYIAAVRVLGIPHPPGNPLFILLAHAFADLCALLPLSLSYAVRINLLAAVTSAAAAALWFLVTHRALRGHGLPPSARIACAAAAAWLGATAFSVWNQSVVNEKVYTVAMLGVSLCAWLALRWLDAPPASRRADVLLLCIAYLCGLGYANHPAGLLPLPAVAVLLLARRPATLLRWRLLLALAFVLFVGVTPFAFEPIRAAHNPPINEGAPTACTDGPRLDCMFSTTTYERLAANIRREQYGGHAVAKRQAPLGAQVGMWWMYWKWQWWRDVPKSQQPVQQTLAVAFLLLAALGAYSHWRRDRDSFWFVAPLIVTLTPALIVYLNFKYGWSQAVELGDSVAREVRDRDYFYLWSFASLAVWVGAGIATIWRWAASATQTVTQSAARASTQAATAAASTAAIATMPMTRRVLLTAPVLLVACIPLVGNYRFAPRHDHRFTAAWARDLLGSVEPYGILITNGDNDSFPLWHAQEVEGVRRDVSIVLTPHLGTDWYVRQLLRARVAPYTGDGIAAYAAQSVARPTTPMLALTDAEADAIPPYVEVNASQEFRHGDIRAAVPPGYLTRDQLLVLRLIADSFPARPVYFSLGNYAQALGLGEYIVTQGLAQRLTAQPTRTMPGVITAAGRYVDVPRSAALWSAYGGPTALPAEREWVDDASVGIPTAYAFTGQLLAEAMARGPQPQHAELVMAATARLAGKLHLLRASRSD